jgi:hypothetical protein
MSRLCRLSLAVAVVLAVAAPAAAAAPPTVVQASGPFTVDPPSAGPTFQPLPGGRCLLRLTTTFRFPGVPPAPSTLVGAFTADFEITHLGPCVPFEPAFETFVANGEFSGTVAGVGGTFKFAFRGTIDEASNARGTLVVQVAPEVCEHSAELCSSPASPACAAPTAAHSFSNVRAATPGGRLAREPTNSPVVRARPPRSGVPELAVGPHGISAEGRRLLLYRFGACVSANSNLTHQSPTISAHSTLDRGSGRDEAQDSLRTRLPRSGRRT